MGSQHVVSQGTVSLIWEFRAYQVPVKPQAPSDRELKFGLMDNCKEVLSVKGRFILVAAGILLSIGMMAWVGGASADQPTPEYYLALGDSVAAGQGASGPDRFGYVGLFRRLFRADHEGKERFANVAVPGETSFTFFEDQMARALETINDSDTDIQVVTLTLGANDVLPLIILGHALQTQGVQLANWQWRPPLLPLRATIWPLWPS
jgi:hypothetical protein